MFTTAKHVLLLFALISNIAIAQDFRLVAEQATQLAHVLQSANRFYPRIQAAQARIIEGQAQVMAANGSFDPRIDGSVYSRLSGFYDGTFSGAGLYQDIPFMGAEVFTEYSTSNGAFPIYEDELITANRGEARIGFALSLLRDRDIDDQRFAISKAQLEAEMAEFGLKTAQITTTQQAYIAYTRWLISARLLESYQELLSIAEVRGEALERQVLAGDAAEILLIENRQAILQRQGLVVDANRQVQLSAERLALFLRNDDGLPLYPVYDTALLVPAQNEDFLNSPISQLVNTALANRPDIATAKVLQEQFGLEKRLAANLLKPQLDLRLYAARDFGEGMVTRLGTDNVIALSLSIPLGTRTARGQMASAQARLVAVGHELQLLIDEVERDMRSSLVNLRATSELQRVALLELDVAQTLAEAEARRVEVGTSDLFLLNVRERMLGEAQLNRWQAELNHQIALANYFGVSMNLPGINEMLQ